MENFLLNESCQDFPFFYSINTVPAYLNQKVQQQKQEHKKPLESRLHTSQPVIVFFAAFIT